MRQFNINAVGPSVNPREPRGTREGGKGGGEVLFLQVQVQVLLLLLIHLLKTNQKNRKKKWELENQSHQRLSMCWWSFFSFSFFSFSFSFFFPTEIIHLVPAPQIQENSPAAEAGLEPFFDYLVAINGTRLVSDFWHLRRRSRLSTSLTPFPELSPLWIHRTRKTPRWWIFWRWIWTRSVKSRFTTVNPRRWEVNLLELWKKERKKGNLRAWRVFLIMLLCCVLSRGVHCAKW